MNDRSIDRCRLLTCLESRFMQCVTEAVAQLHTWMRGSPSTALCRHAKRRSSCHVAARRGFSCNVRRRCNDRRRWAAPSIDFAAVWCPITGTRRRFRSGPGIVRCSGPKMGLRVFFLGAAPGVAQRAAENVVKTWPAVSVVGTYSPPLGFEKDIAENNRILHAIAAARPDLLIIGLGAPKQEKWVHKHQHAIDAQVAVCAGATIDFLAGHKQRAPRWIQKSGFEWCYRMLSEPRRLLRRYAIDAWVLPQIVWDEWHKRRHAK